MTDESQQEETLPVHVGSADEPDYAAEMNDIELRDRALGLHSPHDPQGAAQAGASQAQVRLARSLRQGASNGDPDVGRRRGDDPRLLAPRHDSVPRTTGGRRAMKPGAEIEAIAEFWDDRASLEEQAGTRDLIAKELEVEAIAKYVEDGMRVLDAGCGNGLTALELARRYQVEITALDSSTKMIEAAVSRAAGRTLKGSVLFTVRDVQGINDDLGRFDLIYTERVLINLPQQVAREWAMIGLCYLLAPGGLYVMCENSQDGLDGINRLRAGLDLPEIVPPWHNHYLTGKDISGFVEAVWHTVVHESTDDYSSTYYFLSRIVNAALAAQEGREPDYDSPINRLALKLPALVDGFGQGRIWLWRRR